MRPEIGKVLDDAKVLAKNGLITETQLAIVEVALSRSVSTANASTAAAAIDWSKLLETIQKLLPVIVQLLPLILAIFTPKQPPKITPQPTPVPTPDIGVK